MNYIFLLVSFLNYKTTGLILPAIFCSLNSVKRSLLPIKKHVGNFILKSWKSNYERILIFQFTFTTHFTHQNGKFAGGQLRFERIREGIKVVETLSLPGLFMLLVQNDRSRYIEFASQQELYRCGRCHHFAATHSLDKLLDRLKRK